MCIFENSCTWDVQVFMYACMHACGHVHVDGHVDVGMFERPCACCIVLPSQALCSETGWVWPGTGDQTKEIFPVVPTDANEHGHDREGQELRVSVAEEF